MTNFKSADPAAAIPDEPGQARLYANQWRERGQLDMAASIMHAVGLRSVGDPDRIYDCVLYLKECGRHALASELCEAQLTRGPASARLLALAGSVDHELGRFDSARRRYLAAIDAGIDLNHWFLLLSLSITQRYTDPAHPDFALFRKHLGDSRFSLRAQAAAHFALGKAYDDVGDPRRASATFREANRLVKSGVNWSRANWEAFVSTQVAQPYAGTLAVNADCVPVFVVGMVRSGTTLLAEQLGKFPNVRNRGELPFIAYLANQLHSQGLLRDQRAWTQARQIYLAHLRQDDAPAHWYIDKHPLNFRYLGLIRTLLPEARIIYCRRDARDNALSIYSQYFGHADNDFAYDFADMASYAKGCGRLMSYWREVSGLSIHVVDYEQLVSDPASTLDGLRAFLGLPGETQAEPAVGSSGSIGSASMWQARQPIYHRSVGRWQRYAEWLPELQDLFGPSTDH